MTVILNPTARMGQGARRKAEVEQALATASAEAPDDVRWEIVIPTSAGETEGMARAAALGGANVVAAAGGDGTLNAVLNGVMGTPAVLGLLPLGSGNDFARCSGIPVDLPAAARLLLTGEPRPVDVGNVNGRWFLNVAGAGFDGKVAERWQQGHFFRGRAAYIAVIVECLITLRAATLKLTIDGEERTVRSVMCSVCNASSYGGGMLIAPDARMDDGFLDICLVGDARRWEFLHVLPRVFRGGHTTHPKVTMLRARHIRIESDEVLPVLVDGDMMGTTPVEFRVHPGALRIIAPPFPR